MDGTLTMNVGDQVRVVKLSILHIEKKIEYRGTIVRMPLQPPYRRLDDAMVFVMVQGEKRSWPIDPSQIFPVEQP